MANRLVTITVTTPVEYFLLSNSVILPSLTTIRIGRNEDGGLNLKVLDIIHYFSSQLKYFEIGMIYFVHIVFAYLFTPIKQEGKEDVGNAPLLERLALYDCSLDPLKLATGIKKRYGRAGERGKSQKNKLSIKIAWSTMTQNAFDIMAGCLLPGSLEWDGMTTSDSCGVSSDEDFLNVSFRLCLYNKVLILSI